MSLHIKTFVVRTDGVVTYADLQACSAGLRVRVSHAPEGTRIRVPFGRERLVGVLAIGQVSTGGVVLQSHKDLPAAEHAALELAIQEALA